MIFLQPAKRFYLQLKIKNSFSKLFCHPEARQKDLLAEAGMKEILRYRSG
jgi:hypothetical protein